MDQSGKASQRKGTPPNERKATGRQTPPPDQSGKASQRKGTPPNERKATGRQTPPPKIAAGAVVGTSTPPPPAGRTPPPLRASLTTATSSGPFLPSRVAPASGAGGADRSGGHHRSSSWDGRSVTTPPRRRSPSPVPCGSSPPVESSLRRGSMSSRASPSPGRPSSGRVVYKPTHKQPRKQSPSTNGDDDSDHLFKPLRTPTPVARVLGDADTLSKEIEEIFRQLENVTNLCDEIDPGRKPGIVEDSKFKLASTPPQALTPPLSRGRVPSPHANLSHKIQPAPPPGALAPAPNTLKTDTLGKPVRHVKYSGKPNTAPPGGARSAFFFTSLSRR